MQRFNPLALLGMTEALLRPVSALIEKVLPDFIEEDLKSPEVRDRIVDAVDDALTSTQPAAGAVPAEIRRRVIRGVLDLVLDEILLASA